MECTVRPLSEVCAAVAKFTLGQLPWSGAASTVDDKCVHAYDDCSAKMPEQCKIQMEYTDSFNANLHQVIVAPTPWFFERTWNYTTPLLKHRSALHCAAGGSEVCTLQTLCKDYPNGQGITKPPYNSLTDTPWAVNGYYREFYDEAFRYSDRWEDNETPSLTNPFSNVCEMYMYSSRKGNNVKFTTVNDLEKLHASIRKMTDAQKFEYQIAQYSGAIHDILQSKEYQDLVNLQADTVSSYCCQKVCPGVTTAVGAALGYTSYIELFITFMVILLYQFVFGGGYADGEGPEKQTMVAKLKHALAIAGEEVLEDLPEVEDEENTKKTQA